MAVSNPTVNNATDAFRNLRRFLQGRGVNYRRAVVVPGAADSLATPVTVPGMGSHDELISCLDYVGGGSGGAVTSVKELNYETAGALPAQASLSLDSGDLVVYATSEYPGTKGNSLRFATVDPSAASKSLSVVVAGFTVTVNLATDSGSALISTQGDIAAALEAHPEARRMLYAKRENPDTVVDGAHAAANLTGGVDAEIENITKVVTAPVQASLSVQSGDTVWTASSEYPGTKGNAITIKYVGGASKSLGVSVAGSAITVQLATDSGSAITSLNSEVIAAIEAHPEARRMVMVDRESADTVVDDTDTGGGAATATPLASGADESVALAIGSIDAAGDLRVDLLVIDYLTKASH